MYGLEGLGLSEVQLSISELSVVDLGGCGRTTGQTHFMVGPGRGPTKIFSKCKNSAQMPKKNIKITKSDCGDGWG